MAVLGTILAMTLPTGARAEPKVFAHDDWTSVLERFVDDHGLVDYLSLAADRAAFDRYVKAIGRTGPKTVPQRFPTREDQLAYYINAYNALVFRGVLDRGPKIESVWGFTTTGYDFFARQKYQVDGSRVSLHKLEKETIRAEFEDPRIHAALNCASLGCPRLPRRAFDPRQLDAELDAAMSEFVADERNCRLDLSAGTVILSKIFDWFRSDFETFEARQGNGDGGLITYVNRYRASDAKIPSGLTMKFFPYDKRLNKR